MSLTHHEGRVGERMAVVGASGLRRLQTALLSQRSDTGASFTTICEAGQTSLFSIYLLDATPRWKLRGQLSQIHIRKGFVWLPTAPLLQKIKQRLSLSQLLSGAQPTFSKPPPQPFASSAPTHSTGWGSPDVEPPY